MLKDWKSARLDDTDRNLGNLHRWFNSKDGKKPPYTESLELRKFTDGRDYPFRLIGGYWDLIFKTQSEAMAYATDYMKRH